MDWQIGLSIGLLVYAAFVFDILGFLARDELKLRILLLASGILFTIYYFFVADEPLWDAILANGTIDLVNFAMICIVIRERSTFSMSPTAIAIYARFAMMTPGQFRKLLRVGEIIEAPEPQTLAVEGAPLSRLFYVLEGDVVVEKHGTSTSIGSDVFIGEIAFLHATPATATVRLAAGARYLCWTHEALNAEMERHPGIKTAFLAHLNLDMSRKVAASSPGVMAAAGLPA